MTSDPLPDPGSPEHQEMWQMRMREVVTERTNNITMKIRNHSFNIMRGSNTTSVIIDKELKM